MADVPQLAGRVAVITGGSRGIGLAVTAALASHGADVVVCGRSEAVLANARQRLTDLTARAEAPGRWDVTQADVRDAEQAERLVRFAAERFGGLDILINNAGIGHFQEVVEQSVSDWSEVIDTNLSGVFFCCRAAIPVMRRRGSGWIVNISSLAGSHPFAGGAAYCASKAGLDAFTKALMQELRYDDIRVSSIAPGSVNTAFGGETRHAPEAWKLSAADVAQAVVDLLRHDSRSLPSRVEIRPSKPRK